ncbi:glutamate--cysteine ligase [Alkalilimnicola ehrlichii MLHE-1]|uniref:Glutamate--cysteine ligase n=1 Tax=Alkalilimnicola ehrlichii (strain ATCC BAA-1101 / DSM 17681 / MLHE-1) TaxID=187272 RepID=Q0A9D1_ALKEH|nr:glutamate--cysteine ligase [Alkalilimnicola ehrlichii]ABI56556.1 glutamate--cysteine ligase [Alkalilimnicola ehrlichii MLHE-1]
MSAPDEAAVAEPVTRKQALVDWVAAGCKPPEDWRIGTEHEKFVFHRGDLSPVPYQGERGIGQFLARLQRFGWAPVHEGEHIIALKKDKGSITLEPGGQLELSGAPLENIHQSCREVQEHLRQVDEVARELDLGMIGLGFHPTARREDIPWMPKGRYAVMRNYMPKVGTLGLDMMLRTCTVQVNLDFSSERDMVHKFRVGLALQPLATALFANSPFVEGRPSGLLSYRSHVWTDTDNDRCGMLPFVFDEGMSFERYVEHVLDVPMYFVYRDGRYIDVAGQSFRDFMCGRLPGLPGEYPRMSDWEDHLSTLFPEVRMKRFIEMRGADGGPWGRLCALPAFWVGLLYSDRALDEALQLIADWSVEEISALREQVPREGLATRFRGGTLREVALEVLAISRRGLADRAWLDRRGRDEAHFLDLLDGIAQSGRTPAEELLEAWAGRWQQDVAPVFREFAY